MIKEVNIEIVCDNPEEKSNLIKAYESFGYNVYLFGSDERGWYFKAKKKVEESA